MTRARFLIDECLSVGLATLARASGYEASHLRDLDLLGRPDHELTPIIQAGTWCFVTRNARDFRGPDDAKGTSGLYAGLDLHGGLVCLHGPPEGFTKPQQEEAFALALAEIDALGGDPINLLIEIEWSATQITIEVVEFPPATEP